MNRFDPAALSLGETLRLRLAALDGHPDPTAVLDGRGVVVAVNRAWREAFAPDASEAEADAVAGVGRGYFDVLPAAEESTDPESRSPKAKLAALLSGGPAFESVYACHAPDRPRWCRMSAAPLSPPTAGAVVVHSDVTAQVQSEVKLRQLANYDELTGVLRRRRFMERLDEAVASARRYGHPLALALCDVDDLKPINDVRGHAVGDRCLSAFAATLTGAVRATDFVGRYGGDEFVVAFPHTKAADAAAALERARSAAARRAAASDLPRLTATFGVVDLSPEHADAAQLLAAADAALYRGKALGRDRIARGDAYAADATDLDSQSASRRS
jgi:diguanylate cyclase (GGDEF)-like protein